MAFPTVRAVGAIASSTTTISPGLPAGTVAGDLLLMILESPNAAVTASGWSNAPSSPQTDTTDGTRLTILYKVAAGSDATTTNDPGDHVCGRIIGITAGTFNRAAPFNVSAGTTDATSDTSGSIPGAVTTLKDCLVVAACCSGFDQPVSNSAAEFSSWTNANLANVTERIDNSRTTGTGCGIGAATGEWAGPGDYGATAVTYANASRKGLISLAINPRPSLPLLSRPAIRHLIGR